MELKENEHNLLNEKIIFVSDNEEIQKYSEAKENTEDERQNFLNIKPKKCKLSISYEEEINPDAHVFY